MNGSDTIQDIQQLINIVRADCDGLFNAGNLAIAVGVVTPTTAQDNSGQFLFSTPSALMSASNPAQPIELNELTLFEIASCSKLFTSDIYYMRQNGYDGTLGDKIGPLKSSPIASIAIEDIAFYQSGLPQDNGENDEKVYSKDIFRDLATLFHYWDSHSYTYAPGSCYSYSNMSWSLMAMAALEIDNKETHEFVTNYNKQLQASFNVGSGQTQIYDDTLLTNIPAAYTRKWQLVTDYQPCPLVRHGSGGIVSNLNDMLLYLLINMNLFFSNTPMLKLQQQKAISSFSCSEIYTRFTTGHAWFHKIFKPQGGNVDVLWKNGGNRGFTSWIGFTNWVESESPAQNNGIVVLSNSHVADYVGVQAMNILLGIEPEPCDAEAIAASMARINYETPI